jgi:multiple sugar transport system substrate-binding protein
VSDKVVWSASPGGSLLGGWGVAVNRRSRNLDAAKFWASWLTSTPMTRRLVPLGGTPCRRSAYKYPAFVARYPQYPAMLAALEGDLLTYPPVPQAEQLHIVIFDELNAAIARTKSPEQAAEDMQHKAMDFMTKRGLIRQ